jgi:holo-[acyl-carrier protein] synthase
MEIVGMGSHIVECLRIAQMIQRHGELFLRRVFTAREVEYCSARPIAHEHYAMHWAAKEAVLMALNTKWTGSLDWRDLEIRVRGRDRPTVALGGEAKRRCSDQGISDIMVTLSVCRTHATAYALAVRE